MASIEEITVKLRELLTSAVEDCCKGEKPLGTIYSAGIDSALVTLIASRNCEIKAYCVGTPNSEDLKTARLTREELNFPIEFVEISDDDIEKALPKLIKITGSTEPLQVSVGVPMYFAAGAAKADGVKVLLSGQGGDELFGGYNRYLRHAEKGDMGSLHEAMAGDVGSAYTDNLDRDIAIVTSFGIELRFPYMDEPFGKYAMEIDPSLKIHELAEDEEPEYDCVDEAGGKRFIRKYIQRHLAKDLKLPKYIIDRKKKAAQYGSESEKAIKRLAKKHGFKEKASREGRKDYAKMYLESLVG